MQVLQIEGSDPPVMKVIGQVTAESAGELRQRLMATEADGLLILDLSELTYIDTSGLGVLVGVRSHLKKRGVELVVRNTQERVLKIFRLTKLDLLFGLGK